MSMLKWFRRKPVRRYFAVSYCIYREDGVEHGTVRLAVDGGAVPSKATIREGLAASMGNSDIVIVATVEMANEVDLDAYFAGAKMSEECHVRTMQ